MTASFSLSSRPIDQNRFTRIIHLLSVALLVVAGVSRVQAQTSAYLNFPDNAGGAIPALLSQTGAFDDLSTLSVSAGIVAYQVNQPLWSDDAEKLRWIAVPETSGITFAEKDKWIFPAGTVLIKHFQLGEEAYRLETRFEIITDAGGSYFVTYKWRSDNSDADLLGEDGLVETVTLQDGSTQKWAYPSRLECVTCHNDAANVVLGPKTRQLNLEMFNPSKNQMENQLVTWNQLGLFDPPIDETLVSGYDALANIQDESQSIEERDRAYLDVNCALCHNAVDPPSTAAPFDVSYHTPLAETGLVNGQLFIGAGLAGAKVIKPQDPERSLMHFRMATNDPDERMPPLGRDVVDEAARDLILEWILSLDPIANLDVLDFRSRWLFEDDLSDETGQTNGIWRNAPGSSPTFDAGRNGRALSFNGVDDAMEIGNYDLGSDGLTMGLWMYTEELDNPEITLLAKATGSAEQDHFWSLSIVNSDQLRVRVRANGNTTTLVSPAGAITDEEWIHVGATYNGSTLILYVNGDEVTSAPLTGSLDADPSVGASIGDLPSAAGSAPYAGLIDDLRFYARGLSAQDFNRALEGTLLFNEAPIVEIEEPSTGQFALKGEFVTFLGTAEDEEDGDLTDLVQWFSSRDGSFGEGEEVNWNKLTVGEHIIVLTSVDDEDVANSTSVNVTVVPGYQTYIEGFDLFGGETDPLADTDGDGLTQIQEYAFLSNPRIANSGPIRGLSVTDPGGGGDVLAIEFLVSKHAIDLEYVVQYSANLQTWSDAATYFPQGNDVAYGGSMSTAQFETTDEGDVVRVVERTLLDGLSRGFLRLAVRERP